MKNKELLNRILTGLVLTIIVGVVWYFSYIPYVLSAWTALLCGFAIYELYKAAGFKDSYILLVITIGIAVAASFVRIPYYLYCCLVICPLTIVFFLLLMIKRDDFCHFSVKRALFAPSLIVIFQFQAIRELRFLDNGNYYLAFAILICTFTDIFAFVFGKTIGKHKLVPRISPKKTWEGSLGGIGSSIILISLIAFVLQNFAGLQINYGLMILYIVILSITSQFGDLSMSIVKRITGIKDFGKLLPGHGGILDRFDSWLITLPLALILCSYFGFIG